MSAEALLHPEFEPTNGLSLLMRPEAQEKITQINEMIQFKDADAIDERTIEAYKRHRRTLNNLIGYHHIPARAKVAGFGRPLILGKWSMSPDYQTFSDTDLIFNGAGILSDGEKMTTVMNFKTLDADPEYFAFLPNNHNIERFTLSHGSAAKTKEIALSDNIKRIHDFAGLLSVLMRLMTQRTSSNAGDKSSGSSHVSLTSTTRTL